MRGRFDPNSILLLIGILGGMAIIMTGWWAILQVPVDPPAPEPVYEMDIACINAGGTWIEDDGGNICINTRGERSTTDG